MPEGKGQLGFVAEKLNAVGRTCIRALIKKSGLPRIARVNQVILVCAVNLWATTYHRRHRCLLQLLLK